MAQAESVETEGVLDPMTDPEDEYDDSTLAAEYVLRLLDESEHASFEERLQGDPQLRRLVHEWEAHLASIADEVAPTEPPAHVKQSVIATLHGDAPPSRSWSWGWFTGFGSLAAAAVAAFLIFAPILSPPDLTPSFQAELAASDGSLVVTAGVIPATHEIVLDRLVGSAPPGRVLELWLIAEGSTAPVSLGLLAAEGTTRIVVPDDIAPGVRTGTIALSDEPPGGSPTGAPTGEILATGTFVDL